MNTVRTENPHWIGDEPAWDITLTNGEVHKDVIKHDISRALHALYRSGKISLYDSYIDIVRQCHIDNYNRYYVGT